MSSQDGPKTLLEAINYFADENVCVKTLAAIRWPDGVIPCPSCGCTEQHYYIATRRLWKCKACKRQFSVKVGTIFEDSPLPLSKWLPAVWMICGAKNGISSYELHRATGITQKSAWFVLHRIRVAMQQGSFEKFSGDVEVDETYIGGKARNMHRDRKPGQRGMVGKDIVMGFLERGGKVRTLHMPHTRRRLMEETIIDHVEPEGTNLYTDAHGSYRFMSDFYKHQVVDHAVTYVEGQVHTNSLENYWSLLKRTIRGTYVSVEPFHLFRYLDEQAFRYNERKDTDAGRFRKALEQVSGRRLTYTELTGKLPVARVEV